MAPVSHFFRTKVNTSGVRKLGRNVTAECTERKGTKALRNQSRPDTFSLYV